MRAVRVTFHHGMKAQLARHLRLSGVSFPICIVAPVAPPLQSPASTEVVSEHKGDCSGQGRQRIRIDGSRSSARDCQQGWKSGASEGHGARVDERGSARCRAEGRARQPSPAPRAEEPRSRLERAGRWGRRFRPPRQLTRPSARAIGLRSAPWHMIATGDGSRLRTRAPHSPAA